MPDINRKGRVAAGPVLLTAALALVSCGGTSTPLLSSPTGQPTSYTLSGVVSAPTGEPVTGARLQAGSGSATTDDAGRYRLEDLVGTLTIKISKEGYETQTVVAVPTGDHAINIALPPTVRISPGDGVTVTFYPNEPGYALPGYGYEECSAPCKLIRVTAPARGSISLVLTVRDPTRRMTVYTNGGNLSYDPTARLTLPLGFSGVGEHVVYVRLQGGGADPRVDLASTFTPAVVQ